jgi:hypothetical protein
MTSPLQKAINATVDLYQSGRQEDVRLQIIADDIAKQNKLAPRQLYQAVRGQLGPNAPRQRRYR